MNLLARLASFFAVVGVLLVSASASAALQFSTAVAGSANPKRSNQASKTIATNPFNKDAINSGISREDCFDTSQEWSFFYAPASLTGVAYIDIYAKSGDSSTNCEDITVRPGGAAQSCYLIRRLNKSEFTNQWVVIHPYEIIAAVFGHKDASDKTQVNPSTAPALCASDTSGNSPVTITLWSTPFSDSTTVIASGSLPQQTSYDISGPGAPTGMTLGAGNTIINAHFDTFSQTAYPDFKGMRAYCWPRSDFDGGTTTTTDSATSAETATADTAVTDTATDETGSDDASASDARDDGAIDDTGTATADDTGTSTSDETGTSTPTGTCPANIPFEGGKYPPAGLVPCADRGQLSTELTLENLTNSQPYAVAISTYDAWGNSGPLTPVQCITPKLTVDFFEAYKAAGGKGGGGYCAFNGSNTGMYGLGLSAIGLALVGRIARRRKTTRNRP
jgi:hypothetical protein